MKRFFYFLLLVFSGLTVWFLIKNAKRDPKKEKEFNQ